MATKISAEKAIQEWLIEAKRFAKNHPEIIIPSDIDFWDTVKVYSKFNLDPESGLRAAILLFNSKEWNGTE